MDGPWGLGESRETCYEFFDRGVSGVDGLGGLGETCYKILLTARCQFIDVRLDGCDFWCPLASGSKTLGSTAAFACELAATRCVKKTRRSFRTVIDRSDPRQNH